MKYRLNYRTIYKNSIHDLENTYRFFLRGEEGLNRNAQKATTDYMKGYREGMAYCYRGCAQILKKNINEMKKLSPEDTDRK